MSEYGNGQVFNNFGEQDYARDPDKFSQHERLREIFQIRMEVHETRLDMKKALAAGRITQDGGLSIYASAVIGYILELEPLMVRQYPDQGGDYWDEAQLGTINPSPPRGIWDNDELFDVDIRNLECDDSIEIIGLGELAEVGEAVHFTWTYEERGIYGGWKEREHTQRVPIPGHILDNAYRQCNNFLAEIGMDLEPNIDYDEPNPL